jgi:hypothetical protein
MFKPPLIAVAELLARARLSSGPGYVGAWSERPDRSKARRLAFEARLNANWAFRSVDKEIAQ